MGWPLVPSLSVTDPHRRLPTSGLPTLCHNLLQRHKGSGSGQHNPARGCRDGTTWGHLCAHVHTLGSQGARAIWEGTLCASESQRGLGTPLPREVAFRRIRILTCPGSLVSPLTNVPSNSSTLSPSPNVTSPGLETNKK